MSMEELLLEVKSVSKKFDTLQSEVNELKKKAKEYRSRLRSWSISSTRDHRSRSRSTSRRSSHLSRRDYGRSRSSRYHRGDGEGRAKSWADRDPEEKPDYAADPRFSDEEDTDTVEGLVDVSERTYALLTNSCTRSVSHEQRKKTRSGYKLPRVEATRTPKVNHVMKALASPAAKSTDRELSRIQTFVLDSLAPLTTILEDAEKTSLEDVRDAHQRPSD